MLFSDKYLVILRNGSTDVTVCVRRLYSFSGFESLGLLKYCKQNASQKAS